jgi:hypothetical protein
VPFADSVEIVCLNREARDEVAVRLGCVAGSARASGVCLESLRPDVSNSEQLNSVR